MGGCDRITYPSYLALYESGELDRRIEKAYQLLESCSLCPRNCGVNRLKDERGFCQVGKKAMISSYGPHFGEEAPLVGQGGSGTIFITSCNLGCLFCQNYEISHLRIGNEVEDVEFAQMMLYLQALGCHNINIVTPSHIVPQFLSALKIAIEKGLRLPIVYNTGSYDSLETLKLLDGVVDIYMPDAKFADKDIAKELCKAPDYPDVMKKAIKEMHRQVGDLLIDEKGLAVRGLLVRHLVMPEGVAGTEEICRFIAEEISPHTYINIMAQYRPCYKAVGHPKIGRRITRQEFEMALQIAREKGLYRFDQPRWFHFFN
ncbi:radical SAM protein [bacterium]|nr:radical SAM protein [bacterium]